MSVNIVSKLDWNPIKLEVIDWLLVTLQSRNSKGNIVNITFFLVLDLSQDIYCKRTLSQNLVDLQHE